MSDPIQRALRLLEDFRTRAEGIRILERFGADAETRILEELPHVRNEGARWCMIHFLAEYGSETVLNALSQLKVRLDEQEMLQEAVNHMGERLGMHTKPTKSAAPKPVPTEFANTMFSQRQFVDVLSKGQDWTFDQSGHLYTFTVPMPRGRKQVVYADFDEHDKEGDEIILFYTICGKTSPKTYKSALRANAKIRYGAMALKKIRGEDMLVLVRSQLRATADVEEVQKYIKELAIRGESIERALGEEDQY